MISETAYANDGVFGGGSEVPMGGLTTCSCDYGDRYGGGDTRNVDIDIDVAVT